MIGIVMWYLPAIVKRSACSLHVLAVTETEFNGHLSGVSEKKDEIEFTKLNGSWRGMER